MRRIGSATSAWVFVSALFVTALFATSAHAGATTVRDPAWGTPHIYADTDLELARENGRQISRDRLGQLILFARSGRGTLAEAFGLLDPSFVNDDVAARSTAYTSSELNAMFAKWPATEQALVIEYCKGVNDTIEDMYSGAIPEALEVTILKGLSLGADLFGNKNDISDQVDPYYLAPGGADPEHPTAGFQYTPELVMAIASLQIRNFGAESFNEASRLGELQALIDVHGGSSGTEIWRDLNFLNDPLSPITVPDPTAPGYGGPLASVRDLLVRDLAVADAKQAKGADGTADDSKMEVTADATASMADAADAEPEVVALAEAAGRFPERDWAGAAAEVQAARDARAAHASKWGAWPKLGSYSWMIAGNRSATGHPWLGGFPQMGILTPSIMHFIDGRSAETVHAMGMELIAGPVILIGHGDTVAWTSTTAQLRVGDTFFEEIVLEDTDAVRYNDEGTEAPLSKRTEKIYANPFVIKNFVFWRSHERNGNKGSRPINDFIGDAEGTATGGNANDLVDTAASFTGAYVGGYVLIVDGPGAGQIREISSTTADTLTVTVPWTTAPAAGSVYVAAVSGEDIVAVAEDLAYWQEESTSILGWSQMQRADNCLDIRAAARLMPSTHNFPCADNQAFNGIGTDGTGGNIAYYSGGFSRKRQGGAEKLLPMDGTASNPLVVVSGTVDGADPTHLTATGAFVGQTLDPAPYNYRYQNPTQQGSDYIVTITSGTGARQTRRIASNTDDVLTIEWPWGVDPAPGDTFDVQEIVAMPEAINPAEGYMANWNNKAATADDGRGFGRNQRMAFILERLAADSSWDRDKQRQLNKEVAGLLSNGKIGRYLVPRIREAVDGVGNGGNPDVDTVLAQLEAHNGAPEYGRNFVDPVTATTNAGELAFINSLVSALANDIYGDEFSGAVSVPGGSTGLALVLHAIDSAAGDVSGSYTQEYAGDYFNGADWRVVVRDAFSTLASGGIPADTPRPDDNYAHPLAGLFPELVFEGTPAGNRGTWEQIIEVDSTITGEFMFPLGQSGKMTGSLGGVTSIDPNTTSLSPLWRDWRFLPILHVTEDLAGGNADGDGDGVWDAYERWYYGDSSGAATDDTDGDKLDTLHEFLAGSDPTDPDTDDDGVADGKDSSPQDRLGLSKVKGKFKLTTSKPNSDKLGLTAAGPLRDSLFDPVTDDVVISLDEADLSESVYTATLPAGTLLAKNATTYLYKDKTGSIDDLALVLIKLGKDETKPTKFKVKTIKTDFSGLDLSDRVLVLHVTNGTRRTLVGSKEWVPNGTSILQTAK